MKLLEECYIQDYHKYMAVWEPGVGEEFECQYEPVGTGSFLGGKTCKNRDILNAVASGTVHVHVYV